MSYCLRCKNTGYWPENWTCPDCTGEWAAEMAPEAPPQPAHWATPVLAPLTGPERFCRACEAAFPCRCPAPVMGSAGDGG